MAGHTTGTDEPRPADALPEATWYATEIMGLHRGVHKPDQYPDDTPCWFDHTGHCRFHLRDPDPLTNDADALHLWRQLPNPKELHYWDHNVFAYIYLPKKLHQASGWGSTDREAICRAVHAWWHARQGETKA